MMEGSSVEARIEKVLKVDDARIQSPGTCDQYGGFLELLGTPAHEFYLVR